MQNREELATRLNKSTKAELIGLMLELAEQMPQLAEVLEQRLPPFKKPSAKRARAEKPVASKEPKKPKGTPRQSKPPKVPAGPDFFLERETRGKDAFEIWVLSLGVPDLQIGIKRHGLDPTRRSHTWKTLKKLQQLMLSRIEEKRQRGAAFLVE